MREACKAIFAQRLRCDRVEAAKEAETMTQLNRRIFGKLAAMVAAGFALPYVDATAEPPVAVGRA